MKAVILGGAGEVGKELTRDLAQARVFDELVVADVDAGAASALVAELGGDAGATAVGLDLHDREAALRVLEGASLLMNCTSLTLFDKVLELAIEARVDYADLISEPTEAQARAAREAGITAISGLGATPGLSNVLVRHAAEELDELHEVHISWVSLRTVAPTPGLLDTILWEVSEDCDTRLVFQNGRYERAAFLDGAQRVPFAAPMGEQRVYFVPHPEVRTLPRNFPTLRFCAVRGTWRPELMHDMDVLSRYGLLAGETREATSKSIWNRLGGVRDDAPWMLFVHVEIIAGHEGQPIRRVYDVSHSPTWAQRGVGRMTGVTAAVGAELLARHGRTAPGFIDPETYYDPHEFLDTLKGRGTVTVEWTQGPIS